jgi:hypothetical protein
MTQQLIKSAKNLDFRGCTFGRGVISELNQDLLFETTGTSSATIAIDGTFEGILEVNGQNVP